VASNCSNQLLCCAVSLRRQRRTMSGKLWGCSMLGVCGGSIVFHTR